jgi:hypothetical protein
MIVQFERNFYIKLILYMKEGWLVKYQYIIGGIARDSRFSVGWAISSMKSTLEAGIQIRK